MQIQSIYIKLKFYFYEIQNSRIKKFIMPRFLEINLKNKCNIYVNNINFNYLLWP